MYNFDKNTFLKVINGAVSVKPEVDNIVKSVTEKGYKRLFLVGSGGSMAIMMPFEYLIKAHSVIDVRVEIAAELMARGSRVLDKDTLVILSSLSGTTKETVAASKFCKEHGATTICLVGELGTPLADYADYVLVNYSENNFAGDSIYIQLYELIFGLMHANGEFEEYEEFMEEFKALPKALYGMKEEVEPVMIKFAEKYKDE
ncbi:MAG: SIS domain-containing protein, partial [Herbinix sp.]|nr:SIS domain-containing protein [Herbinix sp.]